jgi:hypothetical protein
LSQCFMSSKLPARCAATVAVATNKRKSRSSNLIAGFAVFEEQRRCDAASKCKIDVRRSASASETLEF